MPAMMTACDKPAKLGAPDAIEHKPVRIVDSIVSAVSSARRKVADVTFAPRFEQVPTGTTLASPDMLNRAITDLLVTAACHTPPGGQVKVAISQGAGRIAIDILAQGKTLPPGDLDTFFDVARQRTLHRGGSDFGHDPALTPRGLRLFEGTAFVRNGSTEGIVIEVLLPLESS